MTPRELLYGLQEQLTLLGPTDGPLSVPQLMHLRAAFERMYWDSFYDPKTPCPHEGTKWQLVDGQDRCGMCGRRIEQEAA